MKIAAPSQGAAPAIPWCSISQADSGVTAMPPSDSPVEAGSQAANVATRFKLAGVTTVIYLIDFLGAFFQNDIFKQQSFKPEYANIGLRM